MYNKILKAGPRSFPKCYNVIIYKYSKFKLFKQKY
jgi:hypothetical protein